MMIQFNNSKPHFNILLSIILIVMHLLINIHVPIVWNNFNAAQFSGCAHENKQRPMVENYIGYLRNYKSSVHGGGKKKKKRNKSITIQWSNFYNNVGQNSRDLPTESWWNANNCLLRGRNKEGWRWDGRVLICV